MSVCHANTQAIEMLKCHVTPEEWQWKVCDGKSKPWAGHEEALRSVPCTYHHKGPVTRIDLTRLPKDSSAQEACLSDMRKMVIYLHWKRISELHWKQKKWHPGDLYTLILYDIWLE